MTLADITDAIALIDVAVLLFASGLITAWFHQFKPGLRYLALYFWGITLIEVIAKLYYFAVFEGSNLWLLHIYTLMEFILLSLLYRHLLQLSNRWQYYFQWYYRLMALAIASYSIIGLISHTPEQTELFKLHSKILVNGSVIMYSSAFLLQVLRTPAKFIQGYRGTLTINAAMLLYFAGSFMIFLTMNFLVKATLEQGIILWFINVLLTFLLHLLCIFGLWSKDSRQIRK